MTFSVFVAGTPKPAGSKRAGVAHRRNERGEWEPVKGPDGRLKTFVKDDSGQAGKDWRGDVRAAVQAVVDEPPIRGPVQVALTFVMRRPQAHYRANGELKPNAPTWCVTRPDVDKLSRGVLDALKAVAWEDDSQVVAKWQVKRYQALGESTGVRIDCAPLPDAGTHSGFLAGVVPAKQMQLMADA